MTFILRIAHSSVLSHESCPSWYALECALRHHTNAITNKLIMKEWYVHDKGFWQPFQLIQTFINNKFGDRNSDYKLIS